MWCIGDWGVLSSECDIHTTLFSQDPGDIEEEGVDRFSELEVGKSFCGSVSSVHDSPCSRDLMEPVAVYMRDLPKIKQPNCQHKSGRGHKAPPLAEELLAVDGHRMRMS